MMENKYEMFAIGDVGNLQNTLIIRDKEIKNEVLNIAKRSWDVN